MVFATAISSSNNGALLSFATTRWPDNGGTMPGEDFAFTTYVDPDRPHNCC